jgi:hypothetical protein
MCSRANRDTLLSTLSALRPEHSWRIHVPLRNVTMGATAHKRDDDASRSAAQAIVAG